MNKKTIIEVETKTNGTIVVAKTNENDYEVVVDGIVRHPFCTGEDVMRALATYLMNQR